MNSTRTYTYTHHVDIDFEAIAERYHLSKNTPIEECDNCVRDYLYDLDDCEYFVIDNQDEIVQDLYNYLQQ